MSTHKSVRTPHLDVPRQSAPIRGYPRLSAPKKLKCPCQSSLRSLPLGNSRVRGISSFRQSYQFIEGQPEAKSRTSNGCSSMPAGSGEITTQLRISLNCIPGRLSARCCPQILCACYFEDEPTVSIIRGLASGSITRKRGSISARFIRRSNLEGNLAPASLSWHWPSKTPISSRRCPSRRLRRTLRVDPASTRTGRDKSSFFCSSAQFFAHLDIGRVLAKTVRLILWLNRKPVS